MIIRSAESWLKSDLDLYYLDAEKVPLQFGQPSLEKIIFMINNFYYVDPEYFRQISINNLFNIDDNPDLILNTFSSWPHLINFPQLTKYKDRFRYIFTDTEKNAVSIALGKYSNGIFTPVLSHFNLSADKELFEKITKDNKNEI